MNRTFQPCRICRSSPASCKAHIIPKQFYKRIRGEEKHLFELHAAEELERRYTQNGIWEQGILCPKCDERLGVFDDYAYEILPEIISPNLVKPLGPGTNLYEVGLVDINKFRRFLAALIWKSACSTHSLFRFVKVGPYLERLEKVLTGEDESLLRQLDCVLVHLMPPRYDKVLIPPYPIKCDGGINCLLFYLYPWKLIIKLDRRPFLHPFNSIVLRGGTVNYAMMTTTFTQGEIQILADVQKRIKQHEFKKRQ